MPKKAKAPAKASKPRGSASSTKTATKKAPATSVATKKVAAKKGAARKTPSKAAAPSGASAARRIDERIQSLADWRGKTLAELRRLIHEADPDVVEEVKWVKPTNPMGVPVWSHAGIICTGEAYKEVVKLTFARGASLPDPTHLFNASLEGGTRRAIDVREGELPDARAFKALIEAAVAENERAGAFKTKRASR